MAWAAWAAAVLGGAGCPVQRRPSRVAGTVPGGRDCPGRLVAGRAIVVAAFGWLPQALPKAWRNCCSNWGAFDLIFPDMKSIGPGR